MHCLKFYINVGEVVPGGNLAPVLAPYNFDLLNFSKEVNEKSQRIYIKGLPISMKVLVYNNKKYNIVFGFCSFKFFVDFLLNNILNVVSLLDFYNLVLLYNYIYNNIYETKQLASILFSNLLSFNKKIKIL